MDGLSVDEKLDEINEKLDVLIEEYDRLNRILLEVDDEIEYR